MKIIRVIVVIVTMGVSAFAADITLSDGRVLKEARIQSQSPRTVVIRHADGLSSVAKALLPPELQAAYPVDEAAAIEADRQVALALETEQARRRDEVERRAQQREALVQKSAAAEVIAARQTEELARQEADQADLRARMGAAVQSYFLNDYERNSANERTCEVTLSEIQPVAGWHNRWAATGQVVIRHFRRLRQDEEINPPPPPPGMTGKQIRRAEYDARFIRTEMRTFEATYSTDGEKPSIEVTLR